MSCSFCGLRSLSPWFLLALAFIGCSGDPAGRIEVVQFGDTVVVHSLEPRIGDTLVPKEVARVGRADGPLEYIFNQIFSFTVTPDGNVLVNDEGEGIREFDSHGRYLGHLARHGEGPAEVLYLRGMSASRGGTVAAYDLGNARITLFREDGTTETVRRPEGMPPYNEDAILFHHDGTLWVAISPVLFPEAGVPHPRAAFARISEAGTLMDTIFTPGELGVLCPMLSDGQNRAGFWEDRREPYFPKAKWTLGPDGTLAFGCSAEYRLDIVHRDGRVVRIERPWVPLQMSEEEKDFKAKWGIIPQLPSDLPAYARALIPGDGRIWIWPTQPSIKYPLSEKQQASFGETHTWLVSWQGAFDVFDHTGEWMAVVKLPDEARYSGFPTQPSIFIRGDTIWAVAVDSLDVQYVVRYEVEGLPSSG